MRRRAVVLLSGGLDSYTAAAVAARDGCELYALSIDYGQRHARELEAAARVAAALGVARHIQIALDLTRFGGSALTSDTPVPRDRALDAADIPITYVPARNTIFLSLSLAWAEVLDADTIVIGVNTLDYSGYPDCRPEYFAAFEKMANLATRRAVEGAPIEIRAPIVDLSKAEIVRRGHELGVDFALTVSCYNADSAGRACSLCDACRFRREGFVRAGLADPTRYQPGAA